MQKLSKGRALPGCGPPGHLAEAEPSPWTGGKGVSGAGIAHPVPAGEKSPGVVRGNEP